MADLHEAFQHFVRELAESGDRADDAYHALLERTPAALPHIHDALRSTLDADVRLRLTQVVAFCGSMEGLPLLSELLEDRDAPIWKTALDGLVTLGELPPARATVLDVLGRSCARADPIKRSWIDEAACAIREQA